MMERYIPKVGDLFFIKGKETCVMKCQAVSDYAIEYSLANYEDEYGAMRIKDQVFVKVK